MKLQNLIVIFIIITIPIILLLSLYISTGIKTIQYQSLYDDGLLNATGDAVFAFEQNTANDKYSGNPEEKRDIINASIKMFEKSLCNACNISSYSTDEIEEYIPAIVFGMYDGFYMYAPSGIYNSETGKVEDYTHNLKSYVYYSEEIKGAGYNNSDIVIRYSLDNYVVVSGNFGSGYETRSGYLIVDTIWKDNIGNTCDEATQYYDKAKDFTEWFNNNFKDYNYLLIDNNNNPEDKDSPFVQHKRKVIKDKIEGVLNSTITAYSERTWGQEYKMPKLSENDWEKIYSNISMLTFFQGKNIGLTKYNGYCVLNSTNNNEYVNPNLMYFIEGDDSVNTYYHDIRCEKCKSASRLIGYKVGSFEKKRVEEKDGNGNTVIDENEKVIYKYEYNHSALACYDCINGQVSVSETVYNYIKNLENDDYIKEAYYTSLARERHNTIKLQ